MNTYRFRQQQSDRTVAVQADMYSIGAVKAAEALSEMTGRRVSPSELVWLGAESEGEDDVELLRRMDYEDKADELMHEFKTADLDEVVRVHLRGIEAENIARYYREGEHWLMGRELAKVIEKWALDTAKALQK